MNTHTIFVDCFNTIIMRRLSPDDVLFLWAKKLHESYTNVSGLDFYEMFKNAEKELARHQKLSTGEGEYTFEEILAQMLERLSFYKLLSPIETATFPETAYRLYSETEQQNHYPNKSIVKFLQNKKSKGTRIYVLSDFYCKKDVLKTWLEALVGKDLIDDIFVSCDAHASKRTGALYTHALKILNLEPKNVLMIGDNFWSDHLSAKKQNLKTKWIFKPYKKKSKALKCHKRKLFIPEEYNQIFQENGKHFNYSNYAFPLYIFTKRLAESLAAAEKKDVFFLAREGWFLKGLFDHFAVKHNLDIKSHYLEVSRNSILSATLEPLEEEDFSFITNSARMLKPRSFLRSFSFSEKQVAEILADAKIAPNRLYKNFVASKAFKALAASKVFQRYYEQMRTIQSQNFQTYLSSFGVDFEKDGISVVDVGWSGTMQSMLKTFFVRTKKTVDVTGYYIGYFGKKIEKGNIKIGLMYSRLTSPLWAESRVHRYRMRDYEQLLRAPKFRTASYSSTPPYVRYAEGNDESFHTQVVAPLQNQIFEKFKNICALDGKIFSNIDSICMKYYYRLIKKISLKDYQFMNACQNSFTDSFGYFGHTLRFDLKFFKWLYFRFMDMVYLTYSAPLVHKKKIHWH